MLLWITSGLFLISLFIVLIGKKTHSWRLKDRAGAAAFILGVVLAFMLLAMVINYVGVNAEIAKSIEHHDFLVVQYETGVYKDKPGLGQYNLLKQIDEWNCELIGMQNLTHDFWVGVFIPDYYDNLDLITVNLFWDVTGGQKK